METQSPRITTHHASVSWDPARTDLQAHTIRLAEQTLQASAAAELGGDGVKADPEELFVASLEELTSWLPEGHHKQTGISIDADELSKAVSTCRSWQEEILLRIRS